MRGDKADDINQWRVVDTAAEFERSDQVFCFTTVREHSCLSAQADVGSPSAMKSHKKCRSLTTQQMTLALRAEFEKFGAKWCEADVRARIMEMDPGAGFLC